MLLEASCKILLLFMIAAAPGCQQAPALGLLIRVSQERETLAKKNIPLVEGNIALCLSMQKMK